MKIIWGWSGIREGLHGPWYRKRRAFTRRGPKTTVLFGPIVLYIYWEWAE